MRIFAIALTALILAGCNTESGVGDQAAAENDTTIRIGVASFAMETCTFCTLIVRVLLTIAPLTSRR